VVRACASTVQVVSVPSASLRLWSMANHATS
jgi:hypothetical protein